MSHTIEARILCTTLLLSLAAMGSARADVTITEHTTVTGAGAMSLIGMTGTTVRSVSGDHERDDSNLTMTSRLVGFLARRAGATQSTELVRLDEGVMDHLDAAKRQYTEESLADMQARTQTALQRSNDARAQSMEPSTMQKEKCQWSDPEVKVSQTGRTETIAGLSAEQTIITALQNCTDPKTGSVCSVGMLVDAWMAPRTPALDELLQFEQDYARKMGYADYTTGAAPQGIGAFFTRYKAAWAAASQHLKTLMANGYAVRDTLALAFGGPRCQGAAAASQAAAAQQSQPSAPSTGEIAQGAASSAGAQAASNAASQTGFGGLAGRLGGQLAGGLFSRFRHESRSSSSASSSAAGGEAAAAEADPLIAEGLIEPIRFTVELQSIDTARVDPATFMVPPGYTRVAARSP